MKLLIITQKIDQNDDVLGFMHGWIAAFAAQCEEVVAVGLYVGSHDLPKNVRVHSLGKEGGVSRLKYLLNFFRIIVSERAHYDTVFVHMNQIYVNLGGLIWRSLGKRVALWYAHGSTPLSLFVAVRLSHIIFTSTKSGFRIPSPKVAVVGQGIDTARFVRTAHPRKGEEPFHALIVGRISPVKDYETLIRALARCVSRGADMTVTIVGGAGLPEQEAYLHGLEQLASELSIRDRVHFTGPMPNAKIATTLDRAHVFVNTSNTGSFDKAVGEAMAAGLPVLTSNEAFTEVLGTLAGELMFPAGNDEVLAQKLEGIMSRTNEEREALGDRLRAIIMERHSLDTFVGRICSRLT